MVPKALRPKYLALMEVLRVMPGPHAESVKEKPDINHGVRLMQDIEAHTDGLHQISNGQYHSHLPDLVPDRR